MVRHKLLGRGKELLTGDLLSAQLFTLKKIRPQRLDVYYIALLSESYKQGGRINFITWLKAFGVGFSYHIRSLFTPMRASALLYHFVRQA